MPQGKRLSGRLSFAGTQSSNASLSDRGHVMAAPRDALQTQGPAA